MTEKYYWFKNPINFQLQSKEILEFSNPQPVMNLTNSDRDFNTKTKYVLNNIHNMNKSDLCTHIEAKNKKKKVMIIGNYYSFTIIQNIR